jgi:hypothetical protein
VYESTKNISKEASTGKENQTSLLSKLNTQSNKQATPGSTPILQGHKTVDLL